MADASADFGAASRVRRLSTPSVDKAVGKVGVPAASGCRSEAAIPLPHV
jgi:hypothetical protein